MQRAQQPLWGSNRGSGNHHKHCCRCKGVFSLAAGGLYVTAKALFADDKAMPQAVLEPIKAAPLAPPPAPTCGTKCMLRKMLNSLGVPATFSCPIREPVQYAMERREIGTRIIGYTRQWLSTASDPTHSPGVIAAAGAASAVPTLIATLPAPALWFAAASLFTVGAVDSYINANVQAQLRAAEFHRLQLEREAAAAATATQASAMMVGPSAVLGAVASTAMTLKSNVKDRAVASRDQVMAVAEQVPALPLHFLAGAAATVGAVMARKPVRTTSPQRPTAANAASASAAGPKLHLLDLSSYLKHHQLSVRVMPTAA